MKFKVLACNSRYTYEPRDLAVFCLQLWRYCLWSGGRCVLLRGRVRSPRAPISCWRRRKPSQRPEPRRCSARDVYHWKTMKEIDLYLIFWTDMKIWEMATPARWSGNNAKLFLSNAGGVCVLLYFTPYLSKPSHGPLHILYVRHENFSPINHKKWNFGLHSYSIL